MRCEYCDQPVPRVIQRGDLVQHRETGTVGLVLNILSAPPIKPGTYLSVAQFGEREGGAIVKLWPADNVDLIHGTIHVTERL